MAQSGSSSRTEDAFHEILDGHLKQGSRPMSHPDKTGPHWTNSAFASALGETDERTVRNWRRGATRPSDARYAEIEAALFGENPAYETQRKELREAHRQAGRKQGRAFSTVEVARRHRPCNLPFHSLGSRFKGRATKLNALRTALTEKGGGQAAVSGRAIHGLGGIGKTRLALEYAWGNEEIYSALLFVPAESPRILEAGIAALSYPVALNLSLSKSATDSDRIEAVLGWLSENPYWLIIFDNVDDEEALIALTNWLPRFRNGHLIITGRLANYPAAIRTIELSALDLYDATSFLLERTEDKRRKANDDAIRAQELADHLGGLALALEQAGAYIESNRIGFSAYIDIWNTTRTKVTNWFKLGAISYKHEVTLATTWKTSVDRLSPEGKRLLQYLSFLDPAPIPDALLDFEIPGETQSYDARAAMEDLYIYSLATTSSDNNIAPVSFTVHRLVQDFTRRRIEPSIYKNTVRSAIEWIEAAFTGKMDDASLWNVLDPLVPHALSITQVAEHSQIYAQTSIILDRLGGIFQSKAQWTQAEEFFRRAIRITESDPEFNYKLLVSHYNNLATLLLEINRINEAEQLHLRAIDIRLKAKEPPGHELGMALSNLAIIFSATHRYTDAEQLFRSALVIHFKDLASDDPSIINTKLNLANLLQQTHREVESETLFRELIILINKRFGPNHPSIATTLMGFSSLLRKLGKYSEAEETARRALNIDELILGKNHPNVARDLDNISSLLLDTGRAREAESICRRALEINETSFSTNHPSIEINLSNLALILTELNRVDEAEELVVRV